MFLLFMSFFKIITPKAYEYKKKIKHNFYIKGEIYMGDRKQFLKEKFAEEVGVSKAIVNGCNHIELFGNREAIVNECRGILEYSESRIKLNLGKISVLFTGSNLCMKEYGSSFASVSGDIMTVEFV